MGPWWLTLHLCLYICEKCEMSRLWRTNTRTVESSAVFSLSWIRNYRSQTNWNVEDRTKPQITTQGEMSIEHACLMWEEVVKAQIVLIGSSIRWAGPEFGNPGRLQLQTQDPVGPSNNFVWNIKATSLTAKASLSMTTEPTSKNDKEKTTTLNWFHVLDQIQDNLRAKEKCIWEN